MSLLSDLDEIPDEPGVYLIKDKEEKVIYVGKAKSLKKRVKQHFQATALPKEDKLQELAQRVDWIITRNESEALILEKKLVRQLSPKLNSMLKDDKSHLLIRITMEDDYPQLRFARETDPRNRKSVYFGPFTNNTMLRQTAKLVLRLFPICDCGKKMARLGRKGSTASCMREKLRRCLSPYKNNISQEEYMKTVKNVISFLKGNVADLMDNLEEEMWIASQKANFEKAVTLRDLTTAVRTILNIQEDLHSKQKNIDVLGFSEDEGNLALCKLEIRNHRVHNIQNYIYTIDDGNTLETTGEVLTLIYSEKIPKITLLVNENFSSRFKENIGLTFKLPKNKISKQMIHIAEKNARNELLKYQRDIQYQKDSENILEELKETFNLEEEPMVIHGFDISTLGGEHSVGSCVVFVDGKPQKSLYRRFKIRRTFDEPNDYAMMDEVISRKYKSETLKDDPLPDLLVIDGGKGQLNIARKVLKKLQLSIPIISIAKKKEEIFTESMNEPLLLEQNSTVLRLIQYIRDEAHRFALTYHKILRLRTKGQSDFEKIKGIGIRKAQILFTEYKTIETIAQLNVEEIMRKLSVNEMIAEKIIELAKRNFKKSYTND